MNGDVSRGFSWFNLDAGGQTQHTNDLAAEVAIKRS